MFNDDIMTQLIERTITTFDDTHKLITTVGQNAFTNCTSLTSVNLPVASNIGRSAFSICSALKSVNLPVANSLNEYTFSTCSSLTIIDLPIASSLGRREFYYCSALTALILRKTDSICTLANTDALSGTPIASGSGYIYVPSALVNTYKSASKWSTYSARFRALESYTVDGTVTGALDPSKI